MPEHRVTHTLDEDPVVHDGHTLGDESPLEFEEGSAVVEGEETARNLVRRHTGLEYDGLVEGAESESSEDSGGVELTSEEWKEMASEYDFEGVNGRHSPEKIQAAYADLSDDEQEQALNTVRD